MSTPDFNSQVGTADYLQLLTVQLRNQDPIDPVDQEGLINDLTQFSILEGIEGLNTSFEDMLKIQEVTQGVNLIGKNVQFQNADGSVQSGRVEEYFNADNTVNLLVNGQRVSIDSVIGVSETPAA